MCTVCGGGVNWIDVELSHYIYIIHSSNKIVRRFDHEGLCQLTVFTQLFHVPT